MRDLLVLTCEHGGNRIPREYAGLFRGQAKLLHSHRGWDPGALELARTLSSKLRRPLISVTWSRLLVEANRSLSNRRIWSSITSGLPKEERESILERWWLPHRTEVEQAVSSGVRSGRRVVHIAVHSFTPELDGEVRDADVGLLYDSRRKGEAAFCRRWAAILRALDPDLRVRNNYPYSGSADGLSTALRKQHPQARYLGIEFELNQALVGSRGWRAFKQHVVASVQELLTSGNSILETQEAP